MSEQGDKLRVGSRVVATPCRFVFDGREYLGQVGDSVASALLANGVRLFGRSVKLRRARGVFTAGPEEPNALLTVGKANATISNVPAPLLLLTEGMILRSQNRWPSLRFDAGAVLSLARGVLGAGFYYKTFMWPSWRTYEPLIRRLAGLGVPPGDANLPAPRVEHVNCDVLVAGAGSTGLAAALAASRAGASVVLCEREPYCGGSSEGTSEVMTTLAALAHAGARILCGTTVVAGGGGEPVIAHGESGGARHETILYRIRAREYVKAVGAIERPIAFIDNDLPGVMLLGSAQRYMVRYGVAAGSRAVLFGNHDGLYLAAQHFVAAGMGVQAVVDTRAEAMVASGDAGLKTCRAELRDRGVLCLSGHAVTAAEGRRAVRAVRVMNLGGGSDGGNGSGRKRGRGGAGDERDGDRRIECDAVLVSGGWGPAPAQQQRGVPFHRSPATLKNEKRQFVDLQNDVTVADLRQALDEGFIDIEHVKRYTTLGIGTEQGATSAALGAAIVAELRGVAPDAVGVSRSRPPYHPVGLSVLLASRSGTKLRVRRRTPLHAWHEAHGAVLEPADLWTRVRYYAANGASAFDAGLVEAARVRRNGGIFDASTLGKIAICGRDAAALLDRLYLTKASSIPVGRAKYMVNLREDGMVLDDGIVLRLAQHEFLATTSTGHAAQMLSHFEFYRDIEFGGKAVALADVTEAWAVIVVAGPKSRQALSLLMGKETGASIAALAHMAFCDGTWRGASVRILRASFSGELAFEIHVRPALTTALWQALIDVGLAPYGLEALDILRVEKGYLTDAELNGQTTPYDLGMEKWVSSNDACVGAALLARPAFRHNARPRLVGLKAVDGRSMILGGAQITERHAPTASVGFIASSVYSPALQEWIGLGLVARSLAQDGAVLLARDPLRGGDTSIRVGPLVAFDPNGERMKS